MDWITENIIHNIIYEKNHSVHHILYLLAWDKNWSYANKCWVHTDIPQRVGPPFGGELIIQMELATDIGLPSLPNGGSKVALKTGSEQAITIWLWWTLNL